jgi:hypothetical protein
MDDKISWLGGWTTEWRPPQRLSEQKHCDKAATTVIRTARTLEAEWWQVCGEAWVRGKRKMNQVLSAVGFAGFHHVTAPSRLARILKLMNRSFV